jgi:hypothetical protein
MRHDVRGLGYVHERCLQLEHRTVWRTEDLLRVSSSARRDDENYWRYVEEEQRSNAKEIAAKPTGFKPFGALGPPSAKPTAERARSLARLLAGGTGY